MGHTVASMRMPDPATAAEALSGTTVGPTPSAAAAAVACAKMQTEWVVLNVDPVSVSRLAGG